MGRIVAAEVLVASLALLLGVFVVAPSASATDPIEDLGTLPGDESSRATAINDAGQIAGASGTRTEVAGAGFRGNGAVTELVAGLRGIGTAATGSYGVGSGVRAGRESQS